MTEEAPQYLKQDKTPFYWDWWRENPVEIILVIFIITLFVAAPWAGCGITPQDIDPSQITVVP